jgi:hypothetical protein
MIEYRIKYTDQGYIVQHLLPYDEDRWETLNIGEFGLIKNAEKALKDHLKAKREAETRFYDASGERVTP